MRKLIALAVLGLALLSGCGQPVSTDTPVNPPPAQRTYYPPIDQTPETTDEDAKAIDVKLTDGSWITCVLYDDSGTGTNLECLETTIRDTK